MSITAREIFYAAYQGAGMVALEQNTLNRDQEEDCRRLYNSMVDTWRADGFTVAHVSRQLFDITTGQGDYTIGPGGEWDTDRPDRIERASVVLTNETGNPEYKMRILTLDEWQRWCLKETQTNWSWCLFYELAGPPLGIVHLLYVPIDAVQVALYLENPLGQIAVAAGTPPDYSTVTLQLQPAYEEALEANLARRILMRAPQKSTLDPDAKQELKILARNGLMLIKSVNHRPLSRTTDLTPAGYRSNVYLGNRYI